MRKHRISPGWLLGLTLVAVVISLPLGTTLGKYVWDEEITNINLEVTPCYYPPEDAYSLQNMSAASANTLRNWIPGETAYAVWLSVDDEEYYQLPATIQVTVDGTLYTVNTASGVSSPGGITFSGSEQSGTLVIPGNLLWGNPSHISITASAVLVPVEPPAEVLPGYQLAPEDSLDHSNQSAPEMPTASVQQPQSPPKEPSLPAEPATPTESVNSVESVGPTDPVEPVDQTDTTESVTLEEPTARENPPEQAEPPSPAGLQFQETGI